LSNAVDLLQQNTEQFQPVIGSMISLEETPMTYQNIVDGHTTGIKTLLSISQERKVP
jgi:hypothetical protein